MSGQAGRRSSGWDQTQIVYAGKSRHYRGLEDDGSPSPDARPDGDESTGAKDRKQRREQFVPERPARTLDDLIVSTNVREQIDVAMSKIALHDIIYTSWELGRIDPCGRRVAINLIGPPGTGKSLCAEGIAHHFGQSLIRVSYAELESKYVGETPKNVVAAFEQATGTKSVLFFDEADSILGKRLTSVTQSSDHSVNVTRSVMLMQLDRFENVVVFASNLPENYDPAFARRILAHIELGLPDHACRERLWAHLMPQAMPRDSGLVPAVLAGLSEGLSGGLIANVVILAATRAARRNGAAGPVNLEDVEAALNQVRLGEQRTGR